MVVGGEADYRRGDYATPVDRETRIVPATLDEALRGRPSDLLKIDVEGAEALVLAGAVGILRETRPSIVLEYHGELVGRRSSSRGWLRLRGGRRNATGASRAVGPPVQPCCRPARSHFGVAPIDASKSPAEQVSPRLDAGRPRCRRRIRSAQRCANTHDSSATPAHRSTD